MRPKDYGDIKRMLFDEFMQENPSKDLQVAFLTGMTWFENAITEKQTREDLYDFLPLRIKYDNLKEQLILVQDLNEKYEALKKEYDELMNLKEQLIFVQETNKKYEELKKKYDGLMNHFDNKFKMSQKEIKEAKLNRKFQQMEEEMKELRKLRKFRDLYYSLMIELRRKDYE